MIAYPFYLERGKVRRIWKAEIYDRVVVTTSGDVGAPPTIKKKTYRHMNAAEVAVSTELNQRLREGYRGVSPERFAELLNEASVPDVAPKGKGVSKSPRPTKKKKSSRARA